MKLYTEEQVRTMLDLAKLNLYGTKIYSKDELIEQQKPIELPSDEEIMQVALENTTDINMQIAFNNGAVYICKLIEGEFNIKEK